MPSAAVAKRPAASTSCWGAARWRTHVCRTRSPPNWASPRRPNRRNAPPMETPCDWRPHLQRLADYSALYHANSSQFLVKRLKGWLKIATVCGNFSAFDAVKRAETVEELFALLASA